MKRYKGASPYDASGLPPTDPRLADPAHRQPTEEKMSEATKTRDKAEQIIDLMSELADDDESTGVLEYDDGPVTGQFVATIDGRRVYLYLNRPEVSP